MYNFQFRKCVYNLYLEKKLNKFLIKHILYIFNISNGTLYNIINEFRKGLHLIIKKNNKKYTKSCLPLFIQKYIYIYVKKNKQFNINYLLRNIKRNYNITTSKSTIYRIIKLYGMTYKKVSLKKIYNAKNKKKYMTKKQLFKLVYKYNLNNILFIDETSIVLNNVPLYGWSNKGKSCNIKQPVVTKKYTLLMGITLSNIFYTIEHDSIDKIKFNKFIEAIDKKYVLFMDNARIHHNKILKEYITNNNINSIYNIPYSPEYNPIEKIFNTLKTTIRNNKINNINSIERFIKTKCTKELLTNTIKSIYN